MTGLHRTAVAQEADYGRTERERLEIRQADALFVAGRAHLLPPDRRADVEARLGGGHLVANTAPADEDMQAMSAAVSGTSLFDAIAAKETERRARNEPTARPEPVVARDEEDMTPPDLRDIFSRRRS